MLKVISVGQHQKRLNRGEIMRYMSLTESNYDELKNDYKHAPHLAAIEKLSLSPEMDGVIVKCNNRQDGYKAVVYMCKKIEMEFAGQMSPLFKSGDCHDEDDDELDAAYPPGDEPYDGEDEEEEERNEVISLLKEDGKLVALPLLSLTELARAFYNAGPQAEFFGNHGIALGTEVETKKPYWFNASYPLVVTCGTAPPLSSPIEVFKSAGRFIFYVVVEDRQSEPLPDFMMSYNEKRMLFELDYEFCQLGIPSTQYYMRVLMESARANGYKIAKSVHIKRIIEDLKGYRNINFESSHDIDILVCKAIKKKSGSSKTLNQADFEKVLVLRQLNTNKPFPGIQPNNALSELNRLIGLNDVKGELARLVKRLKFNKQRKIGGYKTTDVHMAAVFMGNPGTAKTTVARLLGRLLCEEGLLNNQSFTEISRKDLIGEYVGWTAPIVAKIFEQNKGGTIFIDEAYSLMDENGARSYAEEALAEIIRQMENNPETLVIFAGYPERMRDFIKNANPGLRSRLTNIIEFADYSDDEMFDIFCLFVENEDYILEDKDEGKVIVCSFLDRIKELGSENIGNGRLMRRVYKTAIGYMAERENNDMRTFKVCDIQNAVNEIEKAEKLVSDKDKSKIGFFV